MNKKRSEKAVYFVYFVAGSLAVFLGIAEKVKLKKNNPFHSLCTVYGLCRLMQIF